MRVYSYHQPVPGLPDPKKLIELWAQRWMLDGWEPVILNETDAKSHPGFAHYEQRIRKFPSVNPPGYDRACFLRHLAMARIGGGLLVDYDVIPNLGMNLFFAAMSIGLSLPLAILEPTRVPCAVCGTQEGFEDLCDLLSGYEGTEKHISDMTIVRKSDIPAMSYCREHLCSGESVQDHAGDGWKQARLIHFSNGSFTKVGWRGEKADLINRVLRSIGQ